MIQKKFTYFIVGIFAAMVCHAIYRRTDRLSGNPADKVKIDTIYVDKVIRVPGKIKVFKQDNPKPEIVYKADEKLLRGYEAITKENEKLKKYIEAITTRVYEKKYTSGDSLVTVVVKDSITGFLKSQEVVFRLKEQEIPFKERIINKTFEKYPKLTISLGASLRVPNVFKGLGSYTAQECRPLKEPTLVEGIIAVKSRKGYQYQVGIDTQGGARLALIKDLFIKY